MAYVIKEDIIAEISETKNIKQGESNIYSITLHRDFLGNQLNAKKVSVISVAIVNRQGKKILMYNAPQTPGVSDVLNYADTSLGTPGVINFEITEFQSRLLEGGDIFIQISLTFANFFPNAKTYVLPNIKIGQIIAVDPVDGGTGGGTGNGGGSGDGSGDSNNSSIIAGSPVFEIEHTDLDLPSQYGMVSIDSQDPEMISEIIFRNLDKNLVRLTTLENFVVNRMGVDGIEGVIKIKSISSPNFFAIFKITGWERVDSTSGNGVEDDSDSIKISVSLENVSNGPGVTKEIFEIGDSITFDIDTYGITGKDMMQDGILTYTDKNMQVTLATNGANSPTGVYITHSPYYDSYVMVEVNGVSVDLGDNTTSSTAYFSGNDGITPVEIQAIRSGDQLIWNGDIAGFELEVGDDINLIYEVDVDDLR